MNRPQRNLNGLNDNPEKRPDKTPDITGMSIVKMDAESKKS